MHRPGLESLESRQLLAASLTNADVRTILGQAASQTLSASFDEEVIAVTDRDANVLGVFARSGVDLNSPRGQEIRLLAIARARTAALFASNDNAFTSRTARFIIQDHFPQPINGTPGGPLYGVQYSNLIGSDVVSNAPAISGDPGGVPLYIDGQAVGGVGAAGDGHDVLARKELDLLDNYKQGPDVYQGREEADADEGIALAGAAGYMAPKQIQATTIFLDGLRLPFTATDPADDFKTRTLTSLINSGVGAIAGAGAVSGVVIGTPESPFPAATFAGVRGLLKRPASASPDPTNPNYGIEGSGGDPAVSLTSNDVRRVINNAVFQATQTRGGIRRPAGTAALVHVSVVDTQGRILGVFAEDGATNFSYDVAVQKARTANFFSDDSHAFSTRAIGFLSQRDFPPGIDGDDVGPLFGVQDALSKRRSRVLTLRKTTFAQDNPLNNGITIFPGGVPLYKNGVLVGAVGVSGDGVDQDDLIASAGASHYKPINAIRSDELSKQSVRDFITSKARQLFDLFGSDYATSKSPALQADLRIEDVIDRLENLDYRVPYVKFPRNPSV